MDDAAPPLWPTSGRLCSAVAQRIELLLSETGGHLATIMRLVMSNEDRVLSLDPRPHSSLLVTNACVSAGGAWQQALWPATAMECAMAAADLFDDIADGEAAALTAQFGDGAVLMTAAGLLALAAGAVLRGTEDGLPEPMRLELGHCLSDHLVRAADGQARSLSTRSMKDVKDVVGAYELAADKSGPLGALAARLGARTATDNRELLQAYAAYGWHLAVFSQLMNDARDAAPSGSLQKHDVRVGAPTVPLVFAASAGAPAPVKGQGEGESLAAWEEQERRRIAAEGGLAAAVALAEAERLRGLGVLDALSTLGRPVDGLRALLSPPA